MVAGAHELIVVRARVDPDLVILRDEFPPALAVVRESSQPRSWLGDFEPRAGEAKHPIGERLAVSTGPRIVGGIATDAVQELLGLVLRLLRIAAATAARAASAFRAERATGWAA